MKNIPVYNSLDYEDISHLNFVDRQFDFVNNCVLFVDSQIEKLLLDRNLDECAFDEYYSSIIETFQELREVDVDFINFFEFENDLERRFMQSLYDNDDNCKTLGKAYFIQSAIRGLPFTKNFSNYTEVDTVFCYMNTIGIKYPLSVNVDNYEKILNKSMEYYLEYECYREAARLIKVLEKLSTLNNFYESILQQVKS
jgi:hypothetical protein